MTTDGTFVHNSELELHMNEEHEAEKKHKCEECARVFSGMEVKKHMKIHSEGTKYCHFYSNNKHCILEEMGCMLLHI